MRALGAIRDMIEAFKVAGFKPPHIIYVHGDTYTQLMLECQELGYERRAPACADVWLRIEGVFVLNADEDQ